MIENRRPDDRAVSVAVTHVLTIAITTILISGLLLSAGTLLDNERQSGAEHSLETIGERLSTEMAAVDRLNGSENTTLHVEHPRRVSGSTYTVELLEDCSPAPLLGSDTDCLQLRSHQVNADVYVPVRVSNGVVDGETATGGGIAIATNSSGWITIESETR